MARDLVGLLRRVLRVAPAVGRDLSASVPSGGLQFSGWRFGLPEAVVAEEGVEQADEPPHQWLRR